MKTCGPHNAVDGEQRFRELVEALPDAILVHKEEKIVFVNPSCVRLLAAAGPEELLGKTIPEIIRSDYLETIRTRVQESYSTAAPTTPMETALIACDGSSVEIEAVAIPISWGASPAIEVVARDIRKRKEAEHAAEVWQKRLELAQEAGLRIGLWDWDVTSQKVIWSDETYRQFGYTRDTFSGNVEDAVNRVHPEDLPRIEAAIARVVAGAPEYSAQYRLVRPDGSVCWIDAHGVMLRNGSSHMLGVGVDVTSLKKTEHRLQESEEKYLLLLNSTAEAIYGLNLDGNCTFCNPACLRLLGYQTAGDLLGKNMHAIMHHTRSDGTLYPIEDCTIDLGLREGNASHVIDDVLWRADGTSFPAEYWSYPMYKDGKVVGAVVTFLDISDRKQSENAVRRSEEKYRNLFENATYGMYRSAPDGTLLDINPALVRMLGYGCKEELLGKNLDRDVYEDPCVRAAILESYGPGGRVDGAEARWKCKDGTIIVVQTSGGRVRGEDGLISHYEVIVEDVTRSKRLAEEKLLLLDKERLAKAEAEAAKAELLRTVERITDGFLVLARTWNCRYINEQGARYLGCRPEDLIGKNLWSEFPKYVDPSPYVLYRKALEEQVVICEEVYFEKSNRWFDVRIYPSSDGLSIIFRDTTERRESQQKLQQTLDQMRFLSARLQTTREEERKHVARDLHDQIGQILTAIKMDLDWVVKRIQGNQTNIRHRLGGTLALVRDATQSLRKICTELRPGVLDDLGIGAAIEWQANEFAARAGIHCEVSVPAQEFVLDPNCSTAIFRILQESLTNVARHADARNVRVALVCSDARLSLVVEDDGKGIQETDLASSKDSLGVLGMRERAEACGGELHIWGEPTLGTTVAVDIPLPSKGKA